MKLEHCNRDSFMRIIRELELEVVKYVDCFHAAKKELAAAQDRIKDYQDACHQKQEILNWQKERIKELETGKELAEADLAMYGD